MKAMKTGITSATDSRSDKSANPITLPKSEKYRLRLMKIREIYEMNLAYLKRIHPVCEAKCA
jgi:hypothetical protein